ncbi:MAG: hypothetical protein IPJ19_03555 [Planctomycetes bacterium]|nr:hypothetical protein [Planctomycetota bacterium]
MYLALAALAAFAFALGGVLMKHADGLRNTLACVGFLALFGLGAAFQSLAMRGKGLGTTYILVLGLEAALALGLGALLFGETITLQRVFAVLLIVAGIACLRSS